MVFLGKELTTKLLSQKMFFNISILLNTKQGEMRMHGVVGDGTKLPGIPVVCQAPDQGPPTRICSRKEFTGAHRNHNRIEVKPVRSRS